MRSRLSRLEHSIKPRVFRHKLMPALASVVSLLFVASSALSTSPTNSVTVFGPKKFEREKGKPSTYTDTFQGCTNSGKATLRVMNGDSDKTRITSAEIIINGSEVADESDFKRHNNSFEKNITLRQNNTITVKLKSGGCDIDDHDGRKDGRDKHDKGHDGKGDHQNGGDRDSGGKDTSRKSNDKKDDRKNSDKDNHKDGDRDDKNNNHKGDGDHDGDHRDGDHDNGNHHDKPDKSFIVVEVIAQGCGATDSTPPVITITSHQNNQLVITPNITLTGTLDDPSATVTVNGHPAQVTGNTFSYAGLVLNEGSNTITAEAVDPAGNRGTSVITIILSTAPPAAPALNQPATPTNSAQATITGTTGAGLVVNLYQATQANSTPSLAGTVTADGQGRFSIPNITLAEGTNTFTATATNEVGNTSAASAPVTMVLDTIAPVVTITSHQDNQYLRTAAITLSGTVDDPTATVTSGSQAGQVTGNGFTFANVTLQENENIIIVTARDAVGNTGSASVKLNVDTVLPLIQVSAPQQNGLVNTATITVSGSVTELHPAGFWINNNPVQLTNGAFSLAVALQTQGTNSIIIRAADAATNEATVVIPVIQDTVSPIVTITAPANNALLNTTQATIMGRVNEPVAALTVNNVNATINGLDFTALVTLAEGQNPISASATDLAGNFGATGITVTVDTFAPAPPFLFQPPSPTQNPVTAITGTADAGSLVEVFAAAPNAASQAIGTVLVDAQGTFLIPEYTLVEGTTIFTATATDTVENKSALSNPVAATLDTHPPVITVTAPGNNSYTNVATAQVTGAIDDLSATLVINGTSVPVNNGNFSHTASLTSGLNSIVLTATDLASNASTTTVLVTLDQTPPIVTITTPVSGSIRNTLQAQVSGTVNEPVTSVTVNSTPALVSGLTFSVPQFALSEGVNTITVTVTDRAGNTGSNSATITADTQPPVAGITAPAQAAAGATVTVSLTAQDATTGITLAEVIANNKSIWTASMNSEPSTLNSVLYSLSPDTAAGSSVVIQTRVTDAAGNIGTASTQVQVSQGPSGPGYIQGEVYDDSKGLLLEGAVAVIVSAANGAELTRITTQADGVYFIEAPKGDYRISISKPGFSFVERLITVKAEKKTVAVDARITPINGTQHLIDANGGTIKTGASSTAQGSGTFSNYELTIPAAALTSQVDLRLTPVSNQGLMNLLPKGWSPFAVVDVHALTPNSELGTLNFYQPASLKVPAFAILNLAPTSPVTVAAYDLSTHQWIVQESGRVNSDGLNITASIPATGQYAFVLPDAGFTPVVASGQALPSDLTAASLDPATLTASGRVVPPVAPPSQGLMAKGELTISLNSLNGSNGSNDELTSGAIINAKVTERFDLLSGDSVSPADYTQDLVLYQYPCITNIGSGLTTSLTSTTPNSQLGTPNLLTTFPITPSKQFTIVDLMMGKVGISITLPEPDAGGSLVGVDGGRLVDADGTVVSIPSGALTQTVPIQTKTIAPAVVSGLVGADFTLLRAVDLKVTNSVLSTTAELSIPVPTGFNPNLPVVVAKAIDVRSAQKLKLVALARVSGSLITSYFPSMFSATSAVKGVDSSGMYFFLQAKAQLGFVTGIVTDASNNPFNATLVTTDTCSLADLTGVTGKYLIASTVSNFVASAMDIYKYDVGTGTGTIAAANQVATVNLQVKMVPPRVVSTSPANNEQNVLPNSSIVITFSKPLDKTTITAANIVVSEGTNTTLQGVFSVNPEGTIVTFYPSANLKSEMQYALTISKSIKDLQGYVLGQDVTTTFTTKDTTPPLPPAAGSITSTFPDANGYITITATQGSVEATGTVLIVNDTTGEIVSVKPATNGSFTGRISAQLGDEIKIVSMDAAGNQTLITYITFKSDDGKYLVTAKGGIVEGEGGAKLDIPEGALSGPTVIKITSVAENQLPSDNPVTQPGQYLSAINIDTGGVNFNKEVHVSVPVPAGFDTTTPVFVTQPQTLQNADGAEEKVYAIIDSTKVVDGRLTTASPPFDGPMTPGPLVFTAFPALHPAIVSGFTYRDMNENGTYDLGIDQLIKGAVIRTPGGWNYVSYSNSSGFYATFTEVWDIPAMFDPTGGCKEFQLTAIHPQTMNRVTVKPSVCAPPYNVPRLNFKLAGKDTQFPDRTKPTINMNLQVAAGQGPDARFVSGTVPVNTEIEVPISVIDQQMGQVTLSIVYKTSSVTSNYSVPVQESGSSINAYITADNPVPIYKYSYQTNFGSPIAGSNGSFKPNQEGTYALTLEATDAAGNKSIKSLTVRAVTPGTQPAGVDGPPRVDEIVPADNAKEIMVTMPVMVSFSEAIDPATVNENTFMLLNVATNTPVPAIISLNTEAGGTRATLVPKNNLMFGTIYQIVLTNGISDYANSNIGGAALGIENPTTTSFTTKAPQAYDLAVADQFQAATGDIAIYTDQTSGRSFAYITAQDEGWRVVDITDPTKPFVTYKEKMSAGIMSWKYRGVAVNQQTGIMALTDWVQWNWGDGAEMFGYVRFHDLTGNPAKPIKVGQERLAEAFSGVPGKVALDGNYAYVATLMVGVQVVDVDAAKSYSSGNPGASITGVLDTVSLSCTQPGNSNGSDKCMSPNAIIAYRSGKALLTTFSKHLLTLDMSNPQLPQPMSIFFPASSAANFSYEGAWAVGGVADYGYIDEDGNSQVKDLAVTCGSYPTGKIHVIDITDPYNPAVLGVVRDSQGGILTIFANEITISKTSGLVYATAGNAVYVIDIKNPKDPRLLNVVTQTPGAGQLGYSYGLAEKEGWVYLANAQTGLKVLDLDPQELGIEEDSEYRNVSIPATDYYPAIGAKGLTIYGVISGQPLGNDWGLYFVGQPSNLQIGGAVDNQGNITTGQSYISRFTPNDADKKGYAPLYIKWNGSVDSMPENFTIKLQARKIGATSLNTATSTKIYDFAFRRRHNGNVTFKEVLEGKAVFVADGIVSTSTGTSTDKQGFDFVQELLNQVVPRMRQTYDDNTQQWVPNQYKLVDEDGIYSADTYIGAMLFKRSFGIDPNASDTYKKIKKDYGLNATDANNLWWHYKIIEKETLAGKSLQDADTIPNSSLNNTQMDTGLYELYLNVVKKFIDRIIDEAEHYSGDKGTPGQDAPTDQWVARTGQGPAQHGKGMSYSYGGRQSIGDFNKNNANVEVVKRGVVEGCNVGFSNEKKMLFYTTGNYGIDTSNCTSCHTQIPTNKKVLWKDIVDDTLVVPTYEGNISHNACSIGDGYQKYPGLKKVEFDSLNSYWIADFMTGQVLGSTPARPQFKGSYWAGTDCSNLVVKSVVAAKQLNILGVNATIVDPMYSGQLCQCDQNQALSEHAYPLVASQEEAKDEQKTKYLRKGDLISYDGHVAIVYSNKWGESSWKTGGIWDSKKGVWANRKLNYDIIHAFGTQSYSFNKSAVFSRKVIVTGDYIGSAPTGIGRIKLWD